MSINLFFVLVLGLLVGMFSYFSPSYTALQNAKEIPQIELRKFTLYEISHKGIDHVLEGEEGKKFEDRYEITAATFSDNTKRLTQSVSSAKALYKENLVDMQGDVRYHRADGLTFHSKEGQYNTKTSIIRTKGAFEITQNANRIEGEKLYYDTEHDTVSADAIRGTYQLN